MRVLDGRVRVEQSDGGQVLRVAGSGVDVLRELPTAFQVVAVEQDGPRVVLHAADGRAVRATPGQLTRPGSPIPPELDPDHQAHLSAELLDAPTLPARDADDATLTATLRDDRLGEIAFDPCDGVVAHGVPTPSGPVDVRFHAVGHDRVAALLPAVHGLLDALPTLLGQAVEFLWHWGQAAGDTAAGHEAFLDNFGLRALDVYHSGAFALELSDDQTAFAESFLDGYWPTVHFLPDGHPVFVTIEC